MQIAIVVGSHRKESQSSRVGAYIASDLARIDPSATVDTIDLAGNPLPLWDESVWQGDSALSALWKPYRDRMRRADGFVIIAPEWAGMVPPGLKNLLLFAGPKEVGHKPAMIVAVSASRGGSYPVNELRTSGYKNSRLVYIPEHVLIHDVNDMLSGATPAGDRDAWLRRRIEFADRILLEYAKALAPIRTSGLTEHADFPYGM
ncbi:MAG: NADPH-dependent oxidoreductase [Planctomycetota bacterium]|nr:MAG: NADPH-dependent oxidoreductase [Planctomycetota bacterium]